MEVMSAFDGRLTELENILIDNFTSFKSHTCFFLSHCHADHMKGLSQLLLELSNHSNHQIYCSSVSRLILLNKYTHASKNLIKELTTATVVTIPENEIAPSYQVTVTPIPAGHCPGSIMLLFETVNKTILYTGDFRILKNDISKFEPFHSKNQVKLIDKIYLDSTFLNEIYWYFPPRLQVVTKLLNFVQNWISKSSKHNVILVTSAMYGYEFIFVELARKLKCKIHVKDLLYDLFWNVAEIGCFLTKDCKSTRLHAIHMFDKMCSAVNENFLKIKLSAQWYKSVKGATRSPFWREVSSQNILLCYSNHCSCSELVDFLNYLKPKEIEPCAAAVASTKASTKAYVQHLIQSWDIQETEETMNINKSDIKLEKNYRFKLKFSPCSTKNFDDSEEFEPEKRKKII